MVQSNRFIEKTIAGALDFLKEAVFADEYASKKGFLQSRDPRVKVLMVLFLLLAVLFSKDLGFIAAIYGFCLLLAISSAVGIFFFLKRTWLFIPIFALCIAVPALFNMFSPGEALASFKFFAITFVITKPGLLGAAIFFSRVLASVSLCVLLALTTRHYVLLKVLRIFKVSQIFVMVMGMCYRYVYLFIEIIQNTYTAIRSRCGGIDSLRHGQKVVAVNVAGLWRRSYDLHNQVYGAMLSRGWSGEPAILEEFQYGIADIFWLCAVVAVFGVSLWR